MPSKRLWIWCRTLFTSLLGVPASRRLRRSGCGLLVPLRDFTRVLWVLPPANPHSKVKSICGSAIQRVSRRQNPPHFSRCHKSDRAITEKRLTPCRGGSLFLLGGVVFKPETGRFRDRPSLVSRAIRAGKGCGTKGCCHGSAVQSVRPGAGVCREPSSCPAGHDRSPSDR